MKNFFGLLMGIFAFFLVNEMQAQDMMNTKHYRSHFAFMSSLGFNAGVGKITYESHTMNNTIPLFNARQLFLYQFNPHISAGVELGVDIWKKTAFIPLALHFSVDFMDYRVTPHWYVNAGYAFKWYVSSQPEKMTRVIHGAKSGWHVNTGLGFKLYLKERLSLVLAADYKMQYTTIQYSVVKPNEVDYSLITTNRTKNVFYHFIGVRVGLLYW